MVPNAGYPRSNFRALWNCIKCRLFFIWLDIIAITWWLAEILQHGLSRRKPCAYKRWPLLHICIGQLFRDAQSGRIIERRIISLFSFILFECADSIRSFIQYAHQVIFVFAVLFLQGRIFVQNLIILMPLLDQIVSVGPEKPIYFFLNERKLLPGEELLDNSFN